jgi:hypothetical protein
LAYRLWQPELLRETRVLGALFQDTVFRWAWLIVPLSIVIAVVVAVLVTQAIWGFLVALFFYRRSLACAVPDRQFGSRFLDFVRFNGRTRAATHSAKLSMGRKIRAVQVANPPKFFGEMDRRKMRRKRNAPKAHREMKTQKAHQGAAIRRACRLRGIRQSDRLWLISVSEDGGPPSWMR